MSLDASLNVQEPPILFPNSGHSIGKPQQRSLLGKFCPIEDVCSKAMLLSASKHSRDDLAAQWTDLHHAAALEQQVLALGLKFIPERIGSLQKRNIIEVRSTTAAHPSKHRRYKLKQYTTKAGRPVDAPDTIA